MKRLRNNIFATAAVAVACILGTTSAKAQEFTVQGDLVSSYRSEERDPGKRENKFGIIGCNFQRLKEARHEICGNHGGLCLPAGRRRDLVA